MNENVKIAIIDDEPHAQNSIEALLKNFFPEIQHIVKADNVKSGVETIVNFMPNIVLLDINLPDGTGFDILRKIPDKNFVLIFITAYDEFAIKAIKFSALDYILKPVNVNEFTTAISKAIDEIKKNEINQLKIHTFLSNYNSENKLKKIILKTVEMMYIIEIDDIIRCEAENNYTCFYLKSKQKILISTTLKDYEELLSSYNFFRVHKSHFVNMNHVIKFDKRDSGTLIMSDNSKIPVASRKKNQLLDIFNRM